MYKLRVQDFAAGKNFSFNQCSKLNKRVLPFFPGKLFYKSNRKLFLVFAYPDVNTRGVGRILNNYVNPQLRLGFA